MDAWWSSESKLGTAKVVLSTAASVAATVMLARSVAQDLFPYEFQGFLFSKISNIFGRYSKEMTMVVNEMDGYESNTIYESVETYLSTKITPSTRRIRVTKLEKEDNYAIKMEDSEEIPDTFQGVKFKWVFISRDVQHGNPNRRDYNASFTTETRSFEVKFNKKHKDLALNAYLPHIVVQAKNIAREKKTLKIFTLDSSHMYGNLADAWVPVNFDHPATFDKLAMDSQLKEMILKDLDRFVKRRDYYRNVGKAWKRGYLLYGPPGTGKSSLIAAMANYLHYDIYDLELTDIGRNSELRRLLVATANRSILVVEDIDCTVDFHHRQTAAASSSSDDPDSGSADEGVTLSGMLNFIDGLWSSCGDERIIIFTTNHKEKLDPALLRPGRMDVHVHMSYITPSGFRTLASSYLGLEEHELFGQIEDLIRSTQVTPAEVAEQLMRNEGKETILDGLIEFITKKKKENEEAEAEAAVAAKRKEKEEAEATKKAEEETSAQNGKPKHDDNIKENGEILVHDNDEKKC